MPGSVVVRFTVSELSLIEGGVGKDPTSLGYLIVCPFSHELGTGIVVGVSSRSMLFAEHPPA